MMKRAMMIAAVLVAVVALTPGLSAGQSKAAAAPQNVIYDATTALEFFKSLSGDWTSAAAGHEHGAAPASSGSIRSFRTKANGSAVVETIGAGTKNEMETILHMDGDKLLLTHYCALQNAPVLRFVKSSKPGEIKFVFDGGTNFDPKVDAHFHEGTFQVKDKDTIEQSTTVFSNGSAQPESHSVLKRKTPSSSQ
ncbi:MAG: hypothetical protein DMF90_24930 [Acidobacteria bacterium]|nr:MAG: hypothetical protein DMF90_24930 [Acidobacteriota bacterium]